jgi:hypothetical protein
VPEKARRRSFTAQHKLEWWPSTMRRRRVRRARYNNEHRHGSLGLHTAADIHYGRAAAVQADRARVLTGAYHAHPKRFVRKPRPRQPSRPDPGSTRHSRKKPPLSNSQPTV